MLNKNVENFSFPLKIKNKTIVNNQVDLEKVIIIAGIKIIKQYCMVRFVQNDNTTDINKMSAYPAWFAFINKPAALPGFASGNQYGTRKPGFKKS